MLVGVFEVRLTPKQNHIGGLVILGLLPIVMHHREIQRVDAPEIIGVEHMLRAGRGA